MSEGIYTKVDDAYRQCLAALGIRKSAPRWFGRVAKHPDRPALTWGDMQPVDYDELEAAYQSGCDTAEKLRRRDVISLVVGGAALGMIIAGLMAMLIFGGEQCHF